MKGIYNNTLNNTAHLVMQPGGYVLPHVRPLLNGAYAEFFEQLLLFEKVSFELGSMNNRGLSALLEVLPLDYLIRAFDLEALEIILPRTMSMMSAGRFGQGKHDPSLLKGVPPVLIGRVTAGEYGDPEGAVREAMRYTSRYSTGYGEAQLRDVARKVAPYLTLGSDSDGDKANALIRSAYEANELQLVDLPFVGQTDELNYQNRVIMQRLVHEVQEILLVASRNYGMYNAPSVYSLAKSAVGTIEDALNVQRSNDTLLTHNALPNLRVLYSSGKVSLKTALDWRETRENIGFRKWIYMISDPQELQYIVRHYAEAIANPTGFAQTRLGKILKGGMMYGLGQGVTALAGAAAVAALGPVAGIAVADVSVTAAAVGKMGLELTGNQFVDEIAGYLTSGWTPLQFVTKVQKAAED